MRRKDREVVSNIEIFDILNRCETIRIAFKDNEFPYIIPVSFGMEIVNEKAVIYFHCAPEGKKFDLIRMNPKVCIEGDILICTEKTEHSITARYESVIGFGECELLAKKNEIMHGLKLLIEHYNYDDYSLNSCSFMEGLVVFKIVIEQISGKRNLPKASQNTHLE